VNFIQREVSYWQHKTNAIYKPCERQLFSNTHSSLFLEKIVTFEECLGFGSIKESKQEINMIEVLETKERTCLCQSISHNGVWELWESFIW